MIPSPFRVGAFAGALFALAACSSNDSIYVPPAGPQSVSGQSIAYTAVGASDAVGYGASVPCANPPLVASPTCPGGTGYVPLIAGSLAAGGATVTLDDLGISGAVVGPDVAALGNRYGSLGTADQCAPRGAADSIPGDFITNELGKVQANATLVTLFAGGNDTNVIVNALGCGAGGTTTASETAFITTWVTNFANDFHFLVQSIQERAPHAKIVVANLPNFALIPYANLPAPYSTDAERQALQAITTGIDQNVINGTTYFGIRVVDLLCNPASYVAANFYTDGFHPNDAGYAALASGFEAQILAGTPVTPAASCSYASQLATSRLPLLHPIAAFDRAS